MNDRNLQTIEQVRQFLGESETLEFRELSVAHLYNVRRSNAYRGITRRFTKTKPAVSRIGERIKPEAKGKPGYIRIDTVHQGDLSGHKGVYTISMLWMRLRSGKL